MKDQNLPKRCVFLGIKINPNKIQNRHIRTALKRRSNFIFNIFGSGAEHTDKVVYTERARYGDHKEYQEGHREYQEHREKPYGDHTDQVRRGGNISYHGIYGDYSNTPHDC
jgi:hypothetical protein